MTMVQRENLDLFDFFYGDYEGIVSNYLAPLHSWWLIKEDINKCLRLNNTRYLYHLLVFVEPFYLNTTSDDHTLICRVDYIRHFIDCTYEYNNHKLRQTQIDIINIEIKKGNQEVLNLVKDNATLLRYTHSHFSSQRRPSASAW